MARMDDRYHVKETEARRRRAREDCRRFVAGQGPARPKYDVPEMPAGGWSEDAGAGFAEKTALAQPPVAAAKSGKPPRRVVVVPNRIVNVVV